ncbi:rod shape-determining protein MreC [Neisseria weixii]|uniref:Cell shape-determining protein MreC n=1 Tax=Neisseria weixii TaxID=1853276 RepID=A0A3N4MSR2_9NEIS|nr:rod shape-determining protein MreC [Neisseria weixii]RPD86942.1 rod shape-determining protein MreC [Neisseria weixii]RPD87581.1 rod shape-determining protein MreC [Neisseria weixii]
MRQSSLRFDGDNNSRKPLFKLAVYVVLGIALMMLDSHFAAVQSIRQVGATILYPIQWLANQPVRLYQYVGNLSQSQAELLEQNRILQEENGRLKIRLQRDKVNLSELSELKKLYGLQQRGISDVIGAEVISNGKDPLSGKLIINKGSSDGVKNGDAVIDTEGLIGQVTQVQMKSSEISLLSGSKTIVPVVVERTGQRSLLYGNGSKLDLRYFPTGSDLKPNDILLTSGLDSVYPAGIPVATVNQVVRASGAPYYDTTLTPFAALQGSRFVLVLPQHIYAPTEP